jgi:CBS-domain-containing membrane protein
VTPSAITVQRGTAFQEVARLLNEFGITALPVVDDAGHPVGVVSEADLLQRHGSGTDTADDLMTSPAITAHPAWSVVRAARPMRKNKIKRLPVIDDGNHVIGVVSRSDLIQLFLRRDHAIQEEILEDVLTRTLRISPSALTVGVVDGVVTLSGSVPRSSLVPIVLRLCQSVDGVVDVVDRLVYEQDDMPVDARPAAERRRES